MSDDLAPIPRDAWPSDWHPFEDNKSAEERAEAARIYDAEKARTRKQRRGHYEAPKSASQPDDPDTRTNGRKPAAINEKVVLQATRPTPGQTPELAVLLDEVRVFIRGYVVVTAAQADALTLWAAHTHALDAFETTPFLDLTSPTKRCGKTRALDVLELIVARAWRVITPSEAVVYRKIEAVSPTLLFDETDAIFNSKNGDTEPLRALLNAGNRRGTFVPRCVGPSQTLTDFPTYCAKALAGIGALPDTITDRAIVIRLERKRKDEPVMRFRHREGLEAATPLQEALASWAESSVDALAALRPDMPRELNDRAEEAWEPLVAIAELAGGHWPERARIAAVTLSAPDVRDEETLGILLVRDIAAVLREQDTDKLFSRDLVAALNAFEESPWGDIRGKPLDERGLARRLKHFGVRPRTVHYEDGTSAKGYLLEDLEDVFGRYLDDFERPTVRTICSSQKQGAFARPPEERGTPRKPAWSNDPDGWTDKTPGEPSGTVNEEEIDTSSGWLKRALDADEAQGNP